MSETVFTNARIVTATAIVEGTVVVRDGRIGAVEPSRSRAAGAIDCASDYLLPGLVELHTDNLEKHVSPRPGVRWPAGAALLAHDAQLAAAGITTVFDAIALGDPFEATGRIETLRTARDAISDAQGAGLLRAEHRLHLRCEITSPPCAEMFERLAADPLVRLASIMDHTPGQRQFTDISIYRLYYQKKYGLSDAGFKALVERQTRLQAEHAGPNRRRIVAAAQARGIPLASHDDATLAHVAEAVRDGMILAEFPTTAEAAKAARDAGLAILVGGPNIVLGGSHSGNVGALDLAREGLVDIVSSDYVPASLIEAAFRIAEEAGAFDLPAACRLVSANPARAVGLDDRGEIAPGLRADLIRVRVANGLPVVRAVWRAGERIV